MLTIALYYIFTCFLFVIVDANAVQYILRIIIQPVTLILNAGTFRLAKPRPRSKESIYVVFISSIDVITPAWVKLIMEHGSLHGGGEFAPEINKIAAIQGDDNVCYLLNNNKLLFACSLIIL